MSAEQRVDDAMLGDFDTAHRALAERAREVLESNWLGHATRPAAGLYPHQWSWDAGFIAIGYARFDTRRAAAELRSLFRGQWSDGMLPHIVFNGGGESYFPGPDYWGTERSPYAPPRPRTSGIVQPPIHATAALRTFRHATDRDTARALLEELMPKLAAWHGYLHRERVRPGIGLVEIWHPWESGMDNSPLWDEALSRIVPARVRDWVRADLDHADPAERPTDEDYLRYLHLVDLFRELSYDPERIRAATPFAVADVLMNTLWVQANRDLASIADIIGADGSRFTAWADEAAAAMGEICWDDTLDVFVDFDLVAGAPICTRVGAAFAPLFAGIPDADQARRMVRRLHDEVGERLGATTWMVPSFDPSEPGFMPTNYWRGPVWINVNWVLYQGLRRYGYHVEAASLRASLLALAERSGFFEHYDPVTGNGHGADRFAWTAALVLDLLFESGADDARTA